MSVEGLLSEVRSSVLYRPVFEAAESAYYHDRRALSDVKPETSHGGQAQHNKGGKGKGGDKVTAAINEAKQTLHKANKGGRNHRNSHKSESEDYSQLKKELEELKIGYKTLKAELEDLRQLVKGGSAQPAESKPAAAPAEKKEAEADEDFDLFGSDESDDEEKKRVTEERLKAYAAKKAKKPGPIAKSNIIYDIKPWDDTIDIDEIEKSVRSIEMDGLVWGASKKIPVAFDIVKLQITCVVEDEKVSTDDLEEAITGFEDLIQSVDVVAFNKV